jgi:hypothetical protein
VEGVGRGGGAGGSLGKDIGQFLTSPQRSLYTLLQTLGNLDVLARLYVELGSMVI